MSDDTPRRIVLVRHAKADSSFENGHERSLIERGRKEAPMAGRWLAGSGIAPALALCSTATQARETWKLVVSELPRRPKTVYEERLYDASATELIGVLTEVSDAVNDLILVGHNPGLHGLAEALPGAADGDLLDRVRRGGFPTATLAVITFSGPWRSLGSGAGRLVAYWTPNA
ncbi:SixA phosphatase family protein [Allokutzneria oryzae]|uniref:Histidine phosphatase family protein n=1 Tax=Allokutzneria oryzae TaxID=1378989 RepID=A0ABV6A7C1_9PSEU